MRVFAFSLIATCLLPSLAIGDPSITRSIVLDGLQRARNLADLQRITSQSMAARLPNTHFVLTRAERQRWNTAIETFAADVSVATQANGRRGGVDRAQACELLSQLRAHPRLGWQRLSPEAERLGPCNARAFALGLEARRWGIEPGALRHVWAVISGADHTMQKHHVALAIKAEEGRAAGGFWVLDAEHAEPQALPQWIERVARRQQFGGNDPLIAFSEVERLDVQEQGPQSVDYLTSPQRDYLGLYGAAWEVHQQRTRDHGTFDASLLP